MQLEKQVSQKLIFSRKTLAIAESCTGGLLTHRLTNVPGSSAFLIATVVTYANQTKIQLVKVPASLIQKYGAVSAPVAKLMAQNVQKLFGTDFGIAITGIAGPTGGTPQKPVGLVFMAIANSTRLIAEHKIFKGSRIQIKRQATDRALQLLLKMIST